MPVDLTTLNPGEIVINPRTKTPYLLLKKQEIHRTEVVLLNIRTQKETSYQTNINGSITIDASMEQIKPEFSLDTPVIDFKRIDLETAENLILNEQETQIVKTYISRINNPNIYQHFLERDAEKGVKTTKNTPIK